MLTAASAAPLCLRSTAHTHSADDDDDDVRWDVCDVPHAN